MHCFWWWSVDHVPSGELDRQTPEDIADAAQWEGDPETFLRALVKAGFIDMDTDGNYSIHNWDKYGAKIHRKLQQAAERQRKYRESNSVTQKSRVSNALLTQESRTSNAHVTDPDMDIDMDIDTGDTCMSPSEEEKPSKADRSADVARVFAHFKARINPSARGCPTDKILTRLKKWTVEELCQALDLLSRDEWKMSRNGKKPAAWHFQNDDRIEMYLGLPPEGTKDGSNGNGRANQVGPKVDISQYRKYGSYDKT